MKLFSRLKEKMPSIINILLAILSALLLIPAFPGFEFWFLAWFALIPLFLAIRNEKNSIFASFILGWIFGVIFFFGSCWWLTYAPITYAKFPRSVSLFFIILRDLNRRTFSRNFCRIVFDTLKTIRRFCDFFRAVFMDGIRIFEILDNGK